MGTGAGDGARDIEQEIARRYAPKRAPEEARAACERRASGTQRRRLTLI